MHHQANLSSLQIAARFTTNARRKHEEKKQTQSLKSNTRGTVLARERMQGKQHKHELDKPAGPHRHDVPNSKKPARDRCRLGKLSNYKDSHRYGHIALEESQQHDHIRTQSSIEETRNVCTGLKCAPP